VALDLGDAQAVFAVKLIETAHDFADDSPEWAAVMDEAERQEWTVDELLDVAEDASRVRSMCEACAEKFLAKARLLYGVCQAKHEHNEECEEGYLFPGWVGRDREAAGDYVLMLTKNELRVLTASLSRHRMGNAVA